MSPEYRVVAYLALSFLSSRTGRAYGLRNIIKHFCLFGNIFILATLLQTRPCYENLMGKPGIIRPVNSKFSNTYVTIRLQLFQPHCKPRIFDYHLIGFRLETNVFSPEFPDVNVNVHFFFSPAARLAPPTLHGSG
jgi:hypothetical protein